MHRRGRDRAVSEAAKARQRSLDRTHYSSRSPSPPSSASLSPRSPASRSPTPPLSLADRVHIAYAEDDIHLAKVLLLRLQGIEITSDSDPRIAAVTDEDFDACFIPFGRLDDGRGEPSSQPKPKVVSVDPDAHREDTLRAKEALWEAEARRFTEERARCAALKRRSADAMRAVSLEQERIRLVKQREAAAAAVDLRRRMKPTARTLNFSLVPPVPQPAQRFTYDFPFTPRNITPRTGPSRREQEARRPPVPPDVRHSPPRNVLQEPPREPTRVTFKQVLASMQGPLFPLLPCERTPLLSTKVRRQRELLEALLNAGVDLSASGKGKGRAVSVPRGCAVCAPSPVTPKSPSPLSSPNPSTPSSSGLSRAGSWLSFGGSSRSSTASTSTAPSSWAPSSSPSARSSFSSDSPILQSKRLSVSTWLPGARRTTSPGPVSAPARTCLCAHQQHCTRFPVQTHPLVPPEPPNARSTVRRRPAHMGGDEWRVQDGGLGTGMPFTLALGRLVALARNLQAAYVRAVVQGYGVSGEAYDAYDAYGDGSRERASPERESEDVGYSYPAEKPSPAPVLAPMPVPLACKLRVRPAGARACLVDVRCFLAPPASSSVTSSFSADDEPSTDAPAADDDLPDLAPIARLSPLAPTRRAPAPPMKTQLPARLPYALVFSPPAPLPKSPWAAGVGAGALPKSLRASYSWNANEDADSDTSDAESESEDEGEDPERSQAGSSASYRWTRPQRTVLRARAVPNSAFLRLKALHNNSPLHTGADPPPRRPRECVVGLGVDRAPGSGLRFVYAEARAVGV
ncbi:hypothetical protein C8R43DRAFT_1050565 [Mycena crocata]|nr:hypothetical protein C8R43DRAFT_1050565 [Mycena crocata]